MDHRLEWSYWKFEKVCLKAIRVQILQVSPLTVTPVTVTIWIQWPLCQIPLQWHFFQVAKGVTVITVTLFRGRQGCHCKQGNLYLELHIDMVLIIIIICDPRESVTIVLKCKGFNGNLTVSLYNTVSGNHCKFREIISTTYLSAGPSFCGLHHPPSYGSIVSM